MAKKALLIGINYPGTSSELKGCWNDTYAVKDMLIANMGYREQDIITMTDEKEGGSMKPTAMNIMSQLGQLVIGAYRNRLDEIWIHFSGHGVSVKDRNGDEKDGKDEAIVPMDYATSGVITDDLIYRYLRYIPESCKCVCFFDCCHSGTILDLKYSHELGKKRLEDIKYNIIENPSSSLKGQIMLFSGCKDMQKSMGYLEDKRQWIGAMTNSLLNTLKSQNFDITLKTLIQGMNLFMLNNKFTQVPQLSTSFEITNTTLFCSKGDITPFIISS